jgi:hypothetical protein
MKATLWAAPFISKSFLGLLLSLMLTLPLTLVQRAEAQTVTVAFSGNFNAGSIDTLGLFGPPGANLGGLPFSISSWYYPSKLILNSDQCENTQPWYCATVSGIESVSVTVNGITNTVTNIRNEQNAPETSGGVGAGPGQLGGVVIVSCIDGTGNNYGSCNDAGWSVSYSPSTGGNNSINNPGLPSNGTDVFFGYGTHYCNCPSWYGVVNALSFVSPYLLGKSGKNLGDLNLNTILPNLQTPDSASALAADGASAAIVLFQVSSMDPVTFTTNNGTTLLKYQDDFLTTLPTPGNTTLTVTPISIGSLIYAVALLQAPQAGVTPAYSTPITITAQQQGGQVQQAYLPLIPPPVLLVPGLWNKKTSMEYFGSTLSSEAPWASYSSDLIYSLRYDGTLSFASTDSVDQMGNAIASLRRSLQSQGVVGARVDLVAHSMGGLLLRAYSSGTDPGPCDKILNEVNTDPYRSLEDRCQGQFHTIITLDTPEAGSKMASYLYRNEGDTLEATAISDGNAYDFWEAFCASRGATTVAQCLAAYSQPVNAGAVQSLEPDSKALQAAPSPNIPNTTWTAISATNESGIVHKLLSLFIRAVYSSRSDAPSINRILRGQNDDVVALTSELSGPPALYVTDTNLSHTGIFGRGFGDGVTDSPVTVAQTACWLQQPMNPSCASAEPRNMGISMISSAQAEEIQLAPGQLAIGMLSTAKLGSPVTLQLKAGGLRSLEIEQIGEGDSNAHDTVNIPAGDAAGSSVTVIPRVLGKVHFEFTGHFADGSLGMAHSVVNVSVDPLSIVGLRADQEFNTIVINGAKSTYKLHPEIKVRGLSDTVDVEKALTTYRVSSAESDPAVKVDQDGRVTGMHSGTASVMVQFEGYTDKIDVLVK